MRVIPAKAGIHNYHWLMDSGSLLRAVRNDACNILQPTGVQSSDRVRGKPCGRNGLLG